MSRDILEWSSCMNSRGTGAWWWEIPVPRRMTGTIGVLFFREGMVHVCRDNHVETIGKPRVRIAAILGGRRYIAQISPGPATHRGMLEWAHYKLREWVAEAGRRELAGGSAR